MSKLVRTGKVTIREIRDAANDSFTVLVEQPYKVEGANSVVGFFMEGHPGIGARKPLVARLGVSRQQMDKFNFEVGQDVSAVIDNDINIQVTESHEPKTIGFEDDGVTVKLQQAKIAGEGGSFLTKDGKKIYRTAEVVFGEAHDDLIQHDSVAVGATTVLAKRAVASLLDK